MRPDVTPQAPAPSSPGDVAVLRVRGDERSLGRDELAIEEPLEIRLGWTDGDGAHEKTISVTMRTPGEDLDLAVGFLLTEGVIERATQIASVKHCGPSLRADGTGNVVRVSLVSAAGLDLGRLDRHFYTSSSCGVCGKTSLEAVRTVAPAALTVARPWVRPEVLHRLPDTLRAAQAVFARTGGLHASGLFTASGELLAVREDVGRHNALDKLIGARLRQSVLAVGETILLVSGRASFELVQKAWMAGLPVLAAVGAPSSLAVELGREAGMTIVGFLRDGRFTVYTGAERIVASPGGETTHG